MNKQMVTVFTLILLTGCVSAQKEKKEPVPEAVKTAFEQQYPAIKDVDWEKEGSNYEAEFETGDVETSVVYTANGVLVETETALAAAALPQAVTDYVSANFKGEKIKEAAKIVAADGTISYEAEVKGKDLIFDANGNYVKTMEK